MTGFAGVAAAWIMQRVTGIGAQAFAIAAAVALALALLIGGLWWLRDDARRDERTACDAHWEGRLANARAQQFAIGQARQRRSEEIAGQHAQRQAAEMQKAAARLAELERALAKRPRNGAYHKDLLPLLNR
jgi:hypothetical protein